MQNLNYVPLLEIVCKKCGKPLNDEWSFCPYCKSSIEEIDCVYCGKKIRTSWKFCPYCTNKNEAHINKSVDEKSNDWLKNILYK